MLTRQLLLEAQDDAKRDHPIATANTKQVSSRQFPRILQTGVHVEHERIGDGQASKTVAVRIYSEESTLLLGGSLL